MTAVALLAGVALGWAIKDGAVWALAESLRYWRTECLAAERELRSSGRGRIPFERLRVRGRAPEPTGGWVVRVALRQRKPWRPAPWPGWGSA